MSEPTAFLPSLDKSNDTHTAPVLALRASANYIVSGCADHIVRVWLKSSGDLALPPLHGYPQASIKSVEISEELGIIIGGDGKGNITAWRLSDGKRLLVTTAHEDSVLSLHMDTETLVSTSRDQTAKVWKLEVSDKVKSAKLQLRHTLQGHSMAILAAKLYRERIFTSSGDKSIRIWDKHSGELIHTLEGGASIAKFQIKKDATGVEILVGACTDGTIRLYNTATDTELACLEGHTNVVSSVELLDLGLEDARHTEVVSASYDGTIRIWGILQETALSWKCVSEFSFSDAVVTPRPFPMDAAMSEDPVQERERKGRESAMHGAKTANRSLAMQVSGNYLYCCGESAHIVAWRLGARS